MAIHRCESCGPTEDEVFPHDGTMWCAMCFRAEGWSLPRRRTPVQRPGRSKQNYATPTEFLRAVQRKLGIEKFSIDLAASQENTVATLFYDEQTNSLEQDWSNITGWAWLNPPYANIEPWVRKAYESGAQIAMLIPASVGANWWRDWVHEKAAVHFLNGRLAFMRDRPKWLYPKDCALLLYGEDAYDSYSIWNWRHKNEG